MPNGNKNTSTTNPKKTSTKQAAQPSKAATIAKKVALKLLPPVIFLLVFALLCFWIYSILMKNEKFANLMVSVEYAVDVIINGVEEEVDDLTRAQPTDYVIVLPSWISSTSAFAATLDDGTVLEEETEDDQTAEDEPEEDPTEGEIDDTATGDTMYVVFNGIANRETAYFYVPDGTLTLTAKATGESTGMKSFKIALWEKLAGETAYVEDTTIYFYTNDETNTYTITGLDPTKAYRMNFSYDAYGYYIYGVMQVDGVSFDAPVEETEELLDEAA